MVNSVIIILIIFKCLKKISKSLIALTYICWLVTEDTFGIIANSWSNIITLIESALCLKL